MSCFFMGKVLLLLLLLLLLQVGAFGCMQPGQAQTQTQIQTERYIHDTKQWDCGLFFCIFLYLINRGTWDPACKARRLAKKNQQKMDGKVVLTWERRH